MVGKGRMGWRWVTAGVARPPQRRSGARRYPPPCCAEGRASRPSGASFSGIGTWLAQALACKLDSVGVVNEAVEDGVGERGNADQVVPAVDGNLTGDDERFPVIAILDDFKQITRLVGRKRLRSPIIEYEQFDANEGAEEPGIARIAMRDGQVSEESRHAGIKNRHVFSARLVAERTGEPALTETGRPSYQQIAPLDDPIAGREFEEQRAVEAARRLMVDVLDAGGVTQLGDPGPCFKLLLSAWLQFVFEQQPEPFGVFETASFWFVFEFLEPLGQAI